MGRSLFGIATAMIAGATMSSCGDSTRSATPDYEIVPPTPTVLPGTTKQFSVSTDEAVAWGLAESTSPQPEPAPAYPLKVSADGRYLVDEGDRPWRIQADAAWLLSSGSTPQEVDEYLSIRRSQGFNSFYLMAMVHPGGYVAGAPSAPNNYRDDPPFASPGDFSTAGASPESARYWEWIDSIIARAAEHDMVVMLAYTYLGWRGGNQGWYEEVLAQPSREALFDWGVWLGNRYKDTPNLIWFGLGDFTPPAGSEGALRARAIAEGIRSTGARQPLMAEPSPPDELPVEVADFGDLLDLDSFYGYGPGGIGTVYETSDRAWRFSPTTPAWMQEGTYENENNTGLFSAEPWETRRGRFWSVLAGGTAGDGFGTKDMLQLDIPDTLSTPGAAYSTHAFELFSSLPWWELRPSGTDPGFAGRQLITSGGGTWGEFDYITSAVTAHGDWLLAYVPVMKQDQRTFTVDMSALSGPVRARWFDPATGNYIAISNGFDYVPTGTRDFTTPGGRGDDTDDWLLVLDSTGSARCGSITASGQYTAPDTTPDDVKCEVTAALRSDPAVIARTAVGLGGG